MLWEPLARLSENNVVIMNYHVLFLLAVNVGFNE